MVASELLPFPSFLLPDLTREDPNDVTGTSGGGEGFGSATLLRSRSLGLTVIGGVVVLEVVRTETRGFRVTDLGPLVTELFGARVAGTLPTGFVGAIPVVGITNVLTTVVVIELNINVVVVTVVDPSPSSLGAENPVIVLVGSVAVPRIVLDPMMVDTKVLGGITVVNTEVIVKGESLV